MGPYEIYEMIIDDDFYGQETVTADIRYNDKNYSITFNKGDLEVLNAWAFDKDTSVPANLSAGLIDALREDVKKRI